MPQFSSLPALSAATKILIIDSDASSVFLLIEFIKRIWPDIYVMDAYVGVEGIFCVKEKCPDIVITEMRLSDLDGLDIIKLIHALPREQFPNGKHPKILAVTADAFEDRIAAAKALGVDDYIVKPYKLSVLETALRKYIIT